jgi:hypothetical protein
MTDHNTALPINLLNKPLEQHSVVAPLDTHHSSRLSEILCVVAMCKYAPTPEPEQVNAFSLKFEKPRYSTAYLSKLNSIIIERDNKVTRAEQRLVNFKALSKQQEYPSKCAMRPLSRWYEGIKDPAVAAVYKSTLQLIRRLTRGKR